MWLRHMFLLCSGRADPSLASDAGCLWNVLCLPTAHVLILIALVLPNQHTNQQPPVLCPQRARSVKVRGRVTHRTLAFSIPCLRPALDRSLNAGGWRCARFRAKATSVFYRGSASLPPEATAPLWSACSSNHTLSSSEWHPGKQQRFYAAIKPIFCEKTADSG